jgi:L-lactate dehydrogenase complex protein LldG
MEADAVETFEAACAELGVTTSTCTPDGLPDTVAETIETPAVGESLGETLDSRSIDGVTIDPTRDELERAETGLTTAVLGVATSGSLLLEATPDGSELLSLYPRRHVAVLQEQHIVPDLETAFAEMGSILTDGGDVVLVTGPSATADMGDLVIGAHGPRDVHVVLVEDVQ